MQARYLCNGDTSLSVQLADEISIDNSRKVKKLQKALENDPIEGILEVLPTYCSLMIHYEIGRAHV